MVIIKQVHFSVTHARTHERTPTWWYACPAKVPSSGGYPGCSTRNHGTRDWKALLLRRRPSSALWVSTYSSIELYRIHTRYIHTVTYRTLVGPVLVLAIIYHCVCAISLAYICMPRSVVMHRSALCRPEWCTGQQPVGQPVTQSLTQSVGQQIRVR